MSKSKNPYQILFKKAQSSSVIVYGGMTTGKTYLLERMQPQLSVLDSDLLFEAIRGKTYFKRVDWNSAKDKEVHNAVAGEVTKIIEALSHVGVPIFTNLKVKSTIGFSRPAEDVIYHMKKRGGKLVDEKTIDNWYSEKGTSERMKDIGCPMYMLKRDEYLSTFITVKDGNILIDHRALLQRLFKVNVVRPLVVHV